MSVKLEFLSREATDRLAKQIPENLDSYREGRTLQLLSTGDLRTSKITVGQAPDLLDSNGTHRADPEATKLIFRWLQTLTPVQASDERLWTCFCHGPFSKYVHERWKSSLDGSAEPEKRVLEHWFFHGSGVATFVRNALSRLWWFGYLTYDEGFDDPFELTEILLSLQDIQQAFLERSMGRSKPVLKAVLTAIKKHRGQFESAKAKGAIVQRWAKDIQAFGGAFILDALPEERLRFVVEQKLIQRLKS